MPKSKSKRKNKAYRPRTIKVGPYWTPEQQANIEEKLRRVAMFVEVTLPAGTATFWQMDWIEDTLNWFWACCTNGSNTWIRVNSTKSGHCSLMPGTRLTRSWTARRAGKHRDTSRLAMS